ncbi:hypothetical protein SH2C18_15050 [Clostridium sediminicola]|uniref:DUF5320 domain-containing protein n=1 Tax=Clostridium sediminicola TaxID=3114879 RepID=UPI0031F24980
MPRRDGTGPMGQGERTGRGMGLCNATKVVGAIGGLGLGLGFGCRRGFGRRGFSGRGLGRRFRANNFDSSANQQTEKDLLIEEKATLEQRLNEINNQLDSTNNLDTVDNNE